MLLSGYDVLNQNLGELLAMTVLAAIALAALLLEYDHLLALHEGQKHFAIHLCSFYGRSTDLYVAVGINEEHFVEGYSVAFLELVAEMVHIQKLAFFGFELLALDFYNSVHAKLLGIKFVRRAALLGGCAFSEPGAVSAHKITHFLISCQKFWRIEIIFAAGCHLLESGCVLLMSDFKNDNL